MAPSNSNNFTIGTSNGERVAQTRDPFTTLTVVELRGANANRRAVVIANSDLGAGAHGIKETNDCVSGDGAEQRDSGRGCNASRTCDKVGWGKGRGVGDC